MTITAPVEPPGDLDDEDLLHFACPRCYPDGESEGLAYCGAEVAIDVPDTYDPPLEQRCVVCEDLSQSPCERCGYTQ